MSRIMYDAVTVANVPASATLVAGYGDGYYANIPAFRSRFPNARIVEIAVSSQHNLGVVLDVETGDATPAEAPGWVQRRRAAGVDPTVYCNTSTWPAVRAAFTAAGVPEPHYWIAHYDGDPTIPADAVAKQYADPGPYDLSSVAAFWPGVDPAPKEPDMPLTPADIDLLKTELLPELVKEVTAAVWGQIITNDAGALTAATHLGRANVFAGLARKAAEDVDAKLTVAVGGSVDVQALAAALLTAMGHKLDGTAQ